MAGGLTGLPDEKDCVPWLPLLLETRPVLKGLRRYSGHAPDSICCRRAATRVEATGAPPFDWVATLGPIEMPWVSACAGIPADKETSKTYSDIAMVHLCFSKPEIPRARRFAACSCLCAI